MSIGGILGIFLLLMCIALVLVIFGIVCILVCARKMAELESYAVVLLEGRKNMRVVSSTPEDKP